MRAWLKARLLEDERGFSLAEMVAALTLISVGFIALASAASTGARMLAEGRQRQAATEIANRELEHLRNIPYVDAGMATVPLSYSTEPENPDHFLSGDGTSYDHDGDGAFEPLVEDGLIEHTEDLDVGSTDLRIYRFITWVDDPDVTGSQDYKRLTMIAFYRAPVATGRPREVRASALFTPGAFLVEGDASSGTEGSGVGPVPTPTAAPPGSCTGDTSGPTGTFEILSGTGADTGYTASTTVTLRLSPVDPCAPITVEFSNDSVLFGDTVTYDSANPTATWTLSAGDGSKSVWAKFFDGIGNASLVGPESITVDQTPPTAPGTLSRTVSCSGSDRTVILSWGASTDTNLVGYRVYRSIDGGAYEVVASTTSLSASNTHKKSLDSVRFNVKAYDRAGNEGSATNEIVLSKNQCS